ncbi:MAG: hypothetical protein MZV64_43045 [Ignavibacteriales bacterium]|nr:hypothetical protein [Ignavibacteriales bacterium]
MPDAAVHAPAGRHGCRELRPAGAEEVVEAPDRRSRMSARAGPTSRGVSPREVGCGGRQANAPAAGSRS